MPATLPAALSETGSTAAALAAEFKHAYEELSQRIAELEVVLEQPALDSAKLTTLRLKIAQLRLLRGTLISRIATCLKYKISPTEAELVQQLRRGHDDMLKTASAHTGKWTIAAIGANWEGYRSRARQLACSWMEKVRWEQEVLLPLLVRSQYKG